MTETFLYGMNEANHDFTSPESLGKNVFTNAFPLSLIQYMHSEMGLTVPEIRAVATDDGGVSTEHRHRSWAEIIGTDPSKARFMFETIYDGYNEYTHSYANKSDVVVCEGETHKRPLEIKLVVVPTSATAKLARANQSCEIVTRPPTVEQIAYSIAHSFGKERRFQLMETINKALGHPSDYKWTDAEFMSTKVDEFKEAATQITKAGIDVQTPLVITAVWRTKGQTPELDDNAFDAFVWTDLAFLQLFVDAAGPGRKAGTVSRPSRTLMWLVSALYDYATQGSLNFPRTISNMGFDYQSDKAGAFAGAAPLKHMASPEFLNPRVGRFAIEGIIAPSALDELLPERRLDQAIALQHLTNLAEKRGFELGHHAQTYNG